ncbi:MAG: acyl-[acyl-carrier-protein] thioesterase [Ignavibacteria bacterium]
MTPFETEEYILNSNDVDTKERMSPVALCNFMQNLASKAAEKRGFGYTFMQHNGFVWVLVKIIVKVIKYPKWNETVKLQTWVHGIERLKTDRHFILYDNNENEISYAITEWAMIDYKLRRPQIIDNFVDRRKALDVKTADVNYPAKIKQLSNPLLCCSRIIVYSDIDLNGHVSNIKYPEWFLDTYEFDFRHNNIPEEFEMNFLSECKFGQSVNIFKETDGNIHYGSIIRESDNKEVFRIKLKWQL